MSRTFHLFELIHSLTPTEKGYFKRFSKLHSRQKDLKYMRLFDVVESQGIYDDKLAQKLVSDEISAKIFPSVKNYLYNLILKSLESYYGGKHPVIEVRNIMNQATILYNKGLIRHAQKGLKKAKALTDKHELWHMKADLLELERELIILDTGKDLDAQKNIKIIEEEANNLRKIEKLFKCKKFERSLVGQHWSKGIVGMDSEVVIDDLYQEIGIFKEEEAETVHAKLHFNYGSLLYFYIKKENIDKAFEFAQRNFHLIKENPDVVVSDEKKFVRIIYVYLGFCLQLYKEKEFWEGFDLLKKFKSANPRMQTEVFDQQYNLAFNSSIAFCEFERGLDYIKQFEKDEPKFMDQLSSRSLIVFYHLIVYLFHINEEHDLAFDYLNKVEQITGKDTRVDIKCICKIQEITIHFDMKNWLLLKSKVRNAIRFFKQKKLLGEGESALLNGLEKIRKRADIDNRPDLKPLFLELSAGQKSDPNFLWIQRNFDVLAWLESKASKTSFKDILKGKKSDRTK